MEGDITPWPEENPTVQDHEVVEAVVNPLDSSRISTSAVEYSRSTSRIEVEPTKVAKKDKKVTKRKKAVPNTIIIPVVRKPVKREIKKMVWKGTGKAHGIPSLPQEKPKEKITSRGFCDRSLTV
jgi:hypothetical protein